jgi:hypothetical protein
LYNFVQAEARSVSHRWVPKPAPEAERPNNQLDLFSALSDVVGDGIQASEEHADEEWKELAFETVCSVARATLELTSDDVWRVLGKTTEGTHNLSALGPIMLRAKRERIIEPTGLFRTSRALGSEGGRGTLGKPARVWRSLIYQGGA